MGRKEGGDVGKGRNFLLIRKFRQGKYLEIITGFLTSTED